MKLFKSPVFAFFLCLLIVFGSTCLSAKMKMEKKYDKLCDRLFEEVLEYADDNGIDELKVHARNAAASGDYQSLIASFSELSAGRKFSDTDDVDRAILKYNGFLNKTIQRFPARAFVDLWKMSF